MYSTTYNRPLSVPYSTNPYLWSTLACVAGRAVANSDFLLKKNHCVANLVIARRICGIQLSILTNLCGIEVLLSSRTLLRW